MKYDNIYEFLRDCGLSNAEAIVGEQAVLGYTNDEIAQRIYRTQKTVKFHLSAIFKKLKIKNSKSFILFVYEGLFNIYLKDYVSNSGQKKMILPFGHNG